MGRSGSRWLRPKYNISTCVYTICPSSVFTVLDEVKSRGRNQSGGCLGHLGERCWQPRLGLEHLKFAGAMLYQCSAPEGSGPARVRVCGLKAAVRKM